MAAHAQASDGVPAEAGGSRMLNELRDLLQGNAMVTQ
jgi:hypothetical protein